MGDLGIKKTGKLVAQKYYQPTFAYNVETYINSFIICLALKAVHNNFYDVFQFLMIFTHEQINLLIDYITFLLILTNQKRDFYDSSLVIVYQLINIVYKQLIKTIIDAIWLEKVIIDVIVRYYGLPNLIVIDKSSFFISKFRSLLCYILGTKSQLSITFYPQTNSQTKRQNNIIEAYLRVFINFKQNNWTKLL